MSIQALREQKAAKAREYRAILDQNPGPLTEEVKAQLDTIHADIVAIEERITLEERVLAVAADDIASTPRVSNIQVEHKPVYANLGEQLLDVRAMTLDNADATVSSRLSMLLPGLPPESILRVDFW